MTTTTKTRKTSEPTPPPTFEQIAERKTRERLVAYRVLVDRAVAGEQLTEADLEAALECLAFLHLPDSCWQADIRAKTEYVSAVKGEADFMTKRPADEKRLLEIVARLESLDEELKALRAERHALAVMGPHTLGVYKHRQHELRTVHPHVLDDLESAVRFRLEQQRKRKPMEAGR